MTETPPEKTAEARPVVYSTETGQQPRGGHTQTTEATSPLPPPPKKVRKTTTKKHAPRVKAKAEPLHKEVKWPEEFWTQAQAAVRPGERLVPISETEARTVYLR
jgi:hypothetical protein